MALDRQADGESVMTMESDDDDGDGLAWWCFQMFVGVMKSDSSSNK